MKDLLVVISQALVNHPDRVSVREVQGPHTSVLELRVAKEDLGQVIGREGKTANSIRTLLNAASAKSRRRTVLEIVE
jgi:predicted RNA-binding protein YlqC (UPF0109 family)